MIFDLGEGTLISHPNRRRGGRVVGDLDSLIGTRLLLQANSGGGKSWAIRRLLEQTHGHVLQFVVDVEGEFHTLREKFDYILAGRDSGDCPADPKSAPLLARRLLELGTSTILSIDELKARERIQFVRRFLEALLGAPRKLWRPALVVIDEAHVFCPQKGEAESAGAVIDLMTRGRKRGLCGVLATQRISKLHKDAAAEANNKLIGRSALDVDMKRAAEELGLAGKAEQRGLRALKAGHFYVFGPAISGEVVEVKIGGVQTTHPTIGQRSAPPAPPPARVKKILAQLQDIPKEAANEAVTIGALRQTNAELERELRKARRDAERAAAAQPPRVSAEQIATARRSFQALKRAVADAIDSAAEDVIRILTREASSPAPAASKVTRQADPPAPAAAAAPRRPSAPPATSPAFGIGKGPLALLQAIAMLHPRPVSKEQAATIAGYKHKSSTVRNYLATLRQKGCIEGPGDRLELTPAGWAAVGDIERPTSHEELVEMWCSRIGSGPAQILRLASEAYPESLSKADLAELTGYSAGSSTLRNYLAALRVRNLITPSGDCRASDDLFPERA